MAIETGLRTLLLGETSIASLVPPQTIGGIRFYGVFNEDPAQGFKPPFILVAQTGVNPWLTLGTSLGTHATDFDIDCYAYEHEDAIAIAAAVQTFFQDYTGAAGASNRILAVLWQGQRHDAIYEAEGRDVRQHIISTSYTVQHT